MKRIQVDPTVFGEIIRPQDPERRIDVPVDVCLALDLKEGAQVQIGSGHHYTDVQLTKVSGDLNRDAALSVEFRQIVPPIEPPPDIRAVEE